MLSGFLIVTIRIDPMQSAPDLGRSSRAHAAALGKVRLLTRTHAREYLKHSTRRYY